MSADPPPDHRSLTAERRRDAMRRRLIESAMPVFVEKGAESAVINDVIRAAGVARGTFYKYFASMRELQIAISQELANELAAYVEPVVIGIPDPARRVALGLRLFIETARAFPLFAGFVRASGLEVTGPTSLINDYVPPHLSEGIATGRFVDVPIGVLLDMITGAVLLCVVRQVPQPTDSTHIRHVVASALRSLGLSADEAWTIADVHVPPLSLPQDSLVMRTHNQLLPSGAEAKRRDET